MDFFDAVTQRTHIRRYEKTDVEDKLIGVMLYMANQTESAGDLQAWEFIVVRDNKVKEGLYNAALRLNIIREAPVCIVVCADLKKQSLKYHERGEYLYSIQDSASAITMMIVTAELLGLGTNWIRAFDESKVKEILSIPDNIRPVGIITVGYPLERSREPVRSPFEYLTWIDKYHKKSDISYLYQTGPKENVFKPIVNQILDKLKKKEQSSDKVNK
ncbi:MAG: nitroreductase family protein [Candidatus Aenigmarchaeota archaeon]|nr:nitroreductase family protein [Candidatus Aenigmarchaeota archaeon]